MRVVFMGTPPAAVPSLRALADAFDMVAVYTRPDRPKGRGQKLAKSAVKEAASELGLEIVQPKRLRDETQAIRSFDPDAIVVVAYGAILPADILGIPKLGPLNVHFSLLPRWRGAAPVERAILAGDEETGVTTMLMDEGLDTGPILLKEKIPIGSNDTTGSIRDRLADLGAGLIVRSLQELETGSLQPQQQAAEGVTVAGKIDPKESELDPARPAAELDRRVRAMDPAPGAFLWFRGKRLKVWRAQVATGDGEPGALEGAEVQTSKQRLRLIEVQPEGKKRMTADAFANGYRLQTGERIGPEARVGSPDG